MLVHATIQSRLAAIDANGEKRVEARLPRSLKSDQVSVRIGMMRRLASSRSFALGDRAGVLRAAQKRSGRLFRLDVRQRVIVKTLVSRHIGRGAARATGLAKHIAYLGRSGAGLAGAGPGFFDGRRDDLDPKSAAHDWREDRHHFRFIVSPEHGERIADLTGYTREVMRRVAADLGEPNLCWVATCHFDTDQPHAHILVRGRGGDGRDLVIPRDYIGYGFRGRAQEVAQERLGDLSRMEAERRVWRETHAERFTGLDRRLIDAANDDGLVDDGIGSTSAWAALTRGRLRTLEALGLAASEGRWYRLEADLEGKLRALGVRKDVIRTLNQRRLDTGRFAGVAQAGRLEGRVMRAGFHDELGARPYAIIREGEVEQYVRLTPAASPLAAGEHVILDVDASGLARLAVGRAQRMQRG